MSLSGESAVIMGKELLNYRIVNNCLLPAVDLRFHLDTIVLHLFIVITDLERPMP